MKKLKFTKIIATCGPSMKSKEVIAAMVESGTDLFRINFSHGTKEEWSYFIGLIRQVADDFGRNIAIMGDLQGPRIRVSSEIDKLFLSKDDLWKVSAVDSGDKKTIILDNPIFINDIKKGDKIVFDDGKIEVSVQSVGKNSVTAKVVSGGKLLGGKGVNIIGETVQMPSLTGKDKDNIDFAVKHNLDFLAMSFVKTGKDVNLLKSILAEKKADIKVISKIETQQAVNDLDGIIDNSFAIMVARGDLGITLPIARLPLLQREIIAKSIEKGKPVIVATQMMESMVTNSIPTRAEVT
ncbi:MAG: pyruvate kinase, partial [Proteobacteria bacterium]|nr:pyruvate kinase [Pseudomonadota bacterium]